MNMIFQIGKIQIRIMMLGLYLLIVQESRCWSPGSPRCFFFCSLLKTSVILPSKGPAPPAFSHPRALCVQFVILFPFAAWHPLQIIVSTGNYDLEIHKMQNWLYLCCRLNCVLFSHSFIWLSLIPQCLRLWLQGSWELRSYVPFGVASCLPTPR